MPLDTFICGTCQLTFNDIQYFVEHKKDCYLSPQTDIDQAVTVTVTENTFSSTPPDTLKSVPISIAPVPITASISADGTLIGSDGCVISAEQLTNDQQTVIILQEIPQILQTDGPLVPDDNNKEAQTETKNPGKRRGRPKKSIQPIVEKPKVSEKPKVPEIGKDGKYHCVRCKKSFRKERFFVTHKCLACSDYVDITKKEFVDIDSGGEDVVESVDLDVIEDDNDKEYNPLIEDSDPNSESTLSHKVGTVQISTDPDVDGTVPERSTDAILDIPIFKTEEEKVAFETSLNIDLSIADHMFKVHVIEQDLNENAASMSKFSAGKLSLYSCNVCEKVFKTLSHMRLHCLIHTSLKPFKCLRCSYSCNSKGNLYTHMRKHTGQFYKCEQCEFKTVNKSHLLEHEATHNNVRQPCEICQKDYNTTKSLINHIRKYHGMSKNGKEYLKKFMSGRQNKDTTVIHQCHVCNRKFKKKMDRDRHLFVHDIKDIPNIQHCELCDYTASRKIYLENHFQKHRVIYRCVECPGRFLSTVRLIDHLTSVHVKDDPANKWESLFELCIENSMYLPEPDNDVEDSDKEYVNLPAELSGSIMSTNVTDSQNTENANISKVVRPTMRSLLKGDHSTVSSFLNPEAPISVNEQCLVAASEEDGQKEKEDNAEDETLKQDVDIVVLPLSSKIQENTAMETSKDDLTGEKTPASLVPSDDGIKLPSTETVLENDTDIGNDSIWKESVTKNDADGNETVPTPSSDTNGSPTVTSVDILSIGTASVSTNNTDHADRTQSIEITETSNGHSKVDSPENADVTEQTVLAQIENFENSNYNQEDLSSQMHQGAIAENEGVDNETCAEKRDDIDSVETKTAEAEMGEKDCIMDIGNSDHDGHISDGPILDMDNNRIVDCEKVEELIKNLQYLPMSMQIFHKMRETFGGEECEYCGRLFYNRTDYESHVRTHTGDKPFLCNICGYRAITKDNLKRHKEKDHESQQFPCKECDFISTSRTQLWNHTLSHRGLLGLECSVCQEKFENMKQLKTHFLISHPNTSREELNKMIGHRHRMQGKMGRKSYKCPYCERVFISSSSELQKHIWIHQGIKPYKCPVCPHSCRSKNNLQAHMLRHSSEKPFACSECGKGYKSKTALRWHVRSHKDGKLFKCDKCPYEAVQRSHLKRHMETHDVIKRFVCQHCNYSANTQGYMKIHYTRNHKGEQYVSNPIETNTSVDSRVYKCLSCDYLFGNLSDLKRHLRIRHHVQVQSIQAMDDMPVSEVQVLQYDNTMSGDAQGTCAMETSTEEQAIQSITDQQGLDEKTASAVNILQQIIDMSHQASGTFGQQHITVHSEDGQMMDVSLNNDTIIVQQEGEEVLVADGTENVEGDQYIIQYVSHEEDQGDAGMSLVEVETAEEAAPVDVMPLAQVQTAGETDIATEVGRVGT
ncbi:hypothetical protein ScPMuIL_000709 [Solemya velum]